MGDKTIEYAEALGRANRSVRKQRKALKRSWTANIDPASIPDEVLKAERARRNSAKRAVYGAGSGRPSATRPCPKCGVECAAVEMRKHRCGKTLAEVFAAKAEASNAR